MKFSHPAFIDQLEMTARKVISSWSINVCKRYVNNLNTF